MFYDCSSLSSLNLSGFDTTNVQIENSKGVFTNCNSLMLLNTPKKNSLPIELPLVMYDESGNDYINIPDLSESIILHSGSGRGRRYSDAWDADAAQNSLLYDTNLDIYQICRAPISKTLEWNQTGGRKL